MAKTILVADDKTNVRNLVREYLEAEGFRGELLEHVAVVYQHQAE